jgi:hypothetical protein
VNWLQHIYLLFCGYPGVRAVAEASVKMPTGAAAFRHNPSVTKQMRSLANVRTDLQKRLMGIAEVFVDSGSWATVRTVFEVKLPVVEILVFDSCQWLVPFRRRR